MTNGTQVIRLKPQDKKDYMNQVAKKSAMLNFLSKLGLIPPISRMAMGDNKLYVYYEGYDE